jgi:GYF domain 2
LEWFLGRDGHQYGPIKNDEMQTLVRLGEIKADDLVWCARLSNWQAAAVVFSVDPATAPPPATPAAAPVEQPAPEPARVEPQPAANFVTTAIAADIAPTPSAPQPSVETRPSAPPSAPLAAQPTARAARQPSIVSAATQTAQSAIAAGTSAARTAVQSARSQAAARTAEQRADISNVRATGPSLGAIKRRRRMLVAALVPVAALTVGAASYIYWDDIFGSSGAVANTTASASTSTGSVDKPIAAPTQSVTEPADAPRPSFMAGPVWKRVSADFPDWYVERVRAAERLKSADGGDDAVTKYLTESLVSLRRNHAQDALTASHDRIKKIATAFVTNLETLEGHSIGACYDFISHGEASEQVLKSLSNKPVGVAIDAQLAAVFEAIRDGRTTPQAHLPPRKGDYDVLADELVKIGWTDADLKVFSDPRQLSRASPEKVCKLVKDWFRAHLAISDSQTQLRLLIESLKPVVAG